MRKKQNHSGGRHRNRGRGGRSGGDAQSLGRQKKHASTQKEKYQNQARDAQGNGDRVQAEYFLQHVEHYERVLAEIAIKEGERDAKREEQQQAKQAANDAGEEADGNSIKPEDGDAAEQADASEDKPAPRKRARPAAKAKPKNEEIPLPASVIPEAEGQPTAKAAGSEA